jgi:hypothetical protein
MKNGGKAKAKAKAKAKTDSKAGERKGADDAKVSAAAAAKKPAGSGPRVAFPKKNQPPVVGEFAARLPLTAGRRFEAVRIFLLKNKGVTEDVYFYGPKTGWALRYLNEERPLCSLHILDERPMGIVAIDPTATAAVNWASLSDVARQARKAAHGSPSLLWLDIPLDGLGASDFKTLLKAKLAAGTTTAAPPV